MCRLPCVNRQQTIRLCSAETTARGYSCGLWFVQVCVTLLLLSWKSYATKIVFFLFLQFASYSSCGKLNVFLNSRASEQLDKHTGRKAWRVSGKDEMRLRNPSGGICLLPQESQTDTETHKANLQQRHVSVNRMTLLCSDNATCLCSRLALCVHRGSCLLTDQQKRVCVPNRKTKAKKDQTTEQRAGETVGTLQCDRAPGTRLVAGSRE